MHDIIRIVAAPLLALFSVPKYRYFAWIVALELIISSIFVQYLLITDTRMGVYYDIILLFHSILFFNLLLYRARLSLPWDKRSIDARTGWGCMLFLGNAVFYMAILGEFIQNKVYQSASTTFIDSYSNVMIAFQILQFSLLIRVIDIERIIDILYRLSGTRSLFYNGRHSYRLVVSRINDRTNRTGKRYT